MRPARTIEKTIGIFLLSLAARANNIKVENVALQDQETTLDQVYIAFDLSWENSWRDNENHDAAWVFVKFRPPGSNEWEHAILSPVDGDHTPAAGSVISAVSDGTGVFVYNANPHTGDVHYARTRLLWKYGNNGYSFSQGEPLEVSVQAIEMVYSAEGSFYLGSGSTESGSFTDGSWITGAAIPFEITSEAVLDIAPQAGKLWGRSASGANTIGPEGQLPAAFPKGFQAFYCMKYHVTEGQYVSFLNLLPSTQAANRFPDQYGNYRHTIHITEDKYVTLAPDRACGYLSWVDGSAYLDWAGLRPMTEMEFEKACRGAAAPVPNECAWGTPAFTLMSGIEGEDGSGTETALPAGANCIKSGDILGMTRAGIFATNNADKVSAGASYWGIMELGSHPCLLMVSVGLTRGREFEGSHGDGVLSATGNATNSDWPGYSTTTEHVTGVAGAGIRGAHFNNPRTLFSKTSDRESASRTPNTTPYAHYGCRGVRTAP